MSLEKYNRINSRIVFWCLVTVWIPVFSLCGRELQHMIASDIDRDVLKWILSVMIVAVIGFWAVLLWQAKGGKGLIHLIWIIAIALAIMKTSSQIEEWVHFSLFGIFGLITLLTYKWHWGLMLCLLVGAGDELFQWWLPDRVGDIYDVGMNLLACLCGGVVALILKSKNNNNFANNTSDGK